MPCNMRMGDEGPKTDGVMLRVTSRAAVTLD